MEHWHTGGTGRVPAAETGPNTPARLRDHFAKEPLVRASTLSALSPLLLASLVWSASASAQEEAPPADAPAEEAPLESDFADEESDIEQDTDQGQALEDDLDEPDDAKKKDDKQATHLIGARYRMIIIPQFLINMFGVDGGRTAVVHGVGVEYGYSKEHFEIIPSFWWAGYNMEETPFKGPNDGEEAWELVTPNADLFYLTVDMLWKHHFTEQLALTVGLGAGIGIVGGTLERWEAQWVPPASVAVPGDPYTQLVRCPYPVPVPNPNELECPSDGNYGEDTPWPVYPWLTFQTGLRYSPVKQFVGRLDLGIGSSGFWLGIGADYGI